MLHWPLAVVCAAICTARPFVGAAQEPTSSQFSIVSRTSGMVEVDPGSTVSLVLSLENLSRDSLKLLPFLGVPDGWSVVVGSGALSLPPRATDTWVVSIFIPGRAESGTYLLRIGARLLSRDSVPDRAETISVDVRRKHALSLTLVDHPQYVISGHGYELSFRLKNRGNGLANVHVSAQSALDSSPVIDRPAIQLRPDQAATSALRRKTQSGTHRPTRARRRVCWCCSRRQKPNRWPRFRRNLDCVRLLEAQDYLRSSLLEVVCFALIAKNVLNSFFTDDQALTLHSGRKEKTDSNSRRRGTASALGIMSSCPRLLPE